MYCCQSGEFQGDHLDLRTGLGLDLYFGLS